jgi:formyl-CoA transferase
MTMDRLLADPHVRAREMVVDIDHPKLGRVPVTGIPFKLSASPGKIRHLGPDLGEHNAEIYGRLLGLSATELQELQANGVI